MSHTANRPLFEVISEFQIHPQRQRRFIEAIAEQVELHFRRYAGFISASFHASEDGERVISHGRWRSQRDWEAVFDNPDFEPPTREIAWHFSARPMRFHAVRSIENDRGDCA
jgi:heme-degrading monooxygenase HmoA